MASADGSWILPNPSPNPWRRTLKTAVSALLLEVGYQAADNMALETLLEMVQAFIVEAGRSSNAYAEHAGRTQAMVSDVALSLIDLGIDFTAIPQHAKRENKTVFLPPCQSSSIPQSKILQVGERKKHPQHIPDHLPAFPDPHTYIKTQCFKQPANEYQLVREKAASQKKDVEVALTRFIAKTGTTHSLFKDDKSSFPLIAIKPTALPHHMALLPSDSTVADLDTTNSEVKTNDRNGPVDSAGSRGSGTRLDLEIDDTVQEMETIDNPYLIPAKLARSRWK